MRNKYKILVAKSLGKRSVGIPRHRNTDNIKICLKGDRVRGCGLVCLVKDRVM
jgi:hypothetical protein